MCEFLVVCGVCLWECGVVAQSEGPDSVPEVAAAGSSKVDNVLAATFAATHAGLLHSLVEDDFASSFGDAAAHGGT
ncbi:MAG: hypothetical protein KDB03_27805 [Planctomycetales bacterium]|nr:hypothetical protein [Planctomycetales bacterium]